VPTKATPDEFRDGRSLGCAEGHHHM
jgi:hypothetical protein